MENSNKPAFEIRTAQYFADKSKEAKGPYKWLVALEMQQYLTAARNHGLSFEELRELGFRFAVVPDIND